MSVLDLKEMLLLVNVVLKWDVHHRYKSKYHAHKITLVANYVNKLFPPNQEVQVLMHQPLAQSERVSALAYKVDCIT